MIESFKIPSATFPTLTGSIVTFNAQYALPLKSHTVDIDYTGNAISNCFVVNMADDTNISYFQGLLNGTYGFVDLGSLTWTYVNVAGKERFTTDGIASTVKIPTSVSEIPNILTSQYRVISNEDYTSFQYDEVITIVQGFGNIVIIDHSYTDATVFRNSLNGVYLIYELATPTTPTITETEFNTLLSAFNISGEAFKIPFDTPIYGGSYDCLTGIVTSDKDSGGGDISPTYQQTATANCEINLGVNNIFADTGDTTLQYPKFG